VVSYTDKDIQVLSEIEHIQTNPGMYVGDTSDPTSLVEEILDNALDEAEAGYATIILLDIDSANFTYSIYDNGRGIPLTQIDTVCSKLFSGAKFKGKKTAYKISLGMHGVGLVAVNALSKKFIVEVFRDGKRCYYEYVFSKLLQKIEEPYTGKIPYSTRVTFIPSEKYFSSLVPNTDFIKDRLELAAAHFPGVNFLYNVNSKLSSITCTKEEIFKRDLDANDEFSSIISISHKSGSESIFVLLCYNLTGSQTPKIKSNVNLLPVEGGTHILMFQDVLKNVLGKNSKKFNFLAGDIFFGLRAHLHLLLENPSFSGQTKDRLINQKQELEHLFSPLQRQLEAFFSKNPDQLDILLQHFADYRAKLNSKKVIGDVGNKRYLTKFTRLRDCSHRDGELFIVEGQSAAGSLLQCRDPKIHAVMPLKGKIPSVVTKKDLLSNNEISEIIQAVGTGIVPNMDISKLRYDKVIILSDYDEDGKHICCLLLAMFSVLMPEIIKSGKLYICVTPLYAINEKKTFIPLWDVNQLSQARAANRTITRFKGLGEFSPHQLKKVALEPGRKLIPVSFPSNLDDILKLFSSVEKKKELLAEQDSEEEF